MFIQEISISKTETTEETILKKCRTGLRDASSKVLDELELKHLSEEEIAASFGVSRQALVMHRKRINCPNKERSDKGTFREGSSKLLPPEEQRLLRNQN